MIDSPVWDEDETAEKEIEKTLGQDLEQEEDGVAQVLPSVSDEEHALASGAGLTVSRTSGLDSLPQVNRTFTFVSFSTLEVISRLFLFFYLPRIDRVDPIFLKRSLRSLSCGGKDRRLARRSSNRQTFTRIFSVTRYHRRLAIAWLESRTRKRVIESDRGGSNVATAEAGTAG